MAEQSLPNISETPLSEENRGLIDLVSSHAAEFLRVDPTIHSAEEIIAKLDQYVHELQQGKVPSPEGEEKEIFFGCLWGDQLVREFGWEWANVTFHDYEDAQAMGVFSPDRSLAIYPFHFIYGCFENKAPVTILLAHQVLSTPNRVPPLPARGYENVMDNVHHIVPRD